MKLSNNNYIVQPPKVTWVLAANRTNAAIFWKRHGEDMEFLARYANPKGRMREQDLVSDAPGRSKSAVTSGRHSVGNEGVWHEQAAIKFSRFLARQISHGKDAEKFSELLLIAEPRFLGMLRKSLPAKLKKMPIKEVPRELRFLATEKVDRIVRATLKMPREKYGKVA